MSSKSSEKDIAHRFLTELGAPVNELLTLREFARRDPAPELNIEHLDSVCPDIVAIAATEAVGLELTAYSDSESHNRLNKILSELCDAETELADSFPELRGFSIHVSSNKDDVLRKRDVRPLATQVLEFVRTEHAALPFDTDQDRHYSVHGARANQSPFAAWNLLEQHARSITVHFRSSFQDDPATLTGGFGAQFGTRLEHLTQTIVKKADRLKNAYTRGLNGVWLLIHATGDPRSSRIVPMWSQEADRLIRSSARQKAIEAGFDRVYLWDGVRGGFVELVSGQSSTVNQM